MKVKLLLLLLLPSIVLAQVGTNFNEPYGGTGNFTDANTTAHQLGNQVNPAPTVMHTYASGELGFSISWTPSRTLNTGLTDGDGVGVYSNAGIINQTNVTSYADGQAMVLEDPDGFFTVTFDAVDLSGTTNPSFQMDLYVRNTSFESSDGANDRIYIALDIDNGASTVVIIDTDGDGPGGGANDTGLDMNDYMYNGFLLAGSGTDLGHTNAINVDLTPYVGSKVKLIVEYDTNAASEEVILDNILFTEGVYDNTLSASEFNLDAKISLLPNPTRDSFNISSNNVISTLQIFDITGKQVFQTKTVSETIDVSFLNSGIYLVKVQGDNLNVVKKLIKQ
jgi:hypothetical protein